MKGGRHTIGTDRMRTSSLRLKALVGVSIFAGTTIAAIAQEDPLDETPKPTLADVQHPLRPSVATNSSFERIARSERCTTNFSKRSNITTGMQSLPSRPKPTLSNNNSVLSMTKCWMGLTRSI